MTVLDPTVEAVEALESRGPLSASLMAALAGSGALDDFSASVAAWAPQSVLTDEDAQLTLFLLYSLAYGSMGLDAGQYEWDPTLIAARGYLERAFEAELRATVVVGELPEPSREDVARHLFALTAPDSGPSVARFVAKKATDEQLHEFLIHRSIYTLREADPHSWAIPRLKGRPKAALVEIQSDEYGGGRPEWMHAAIFARTMEGLGLDASYGAYVNDVPAITLASLNMMSMFGLNRRLVGAIVGHLAAFEMTSSIPNRHYGNGFRRLGYGPEVTLYFDEHVEADAVHEQIAGLDLAGSLAEDDPSLLEDIVFGAAACLFVDGLAGTAMLDSWTAGNSALRTTGAVDRLR